MDTELDFYKFRGFQVGTGLGIALAALIYIYSGQALSLAVVVPATLAGIGTGALVGRLALSRGQRDLYLKQEAGCS